MKKTSAGGGKKRAAAKKPGAKNGAAARPKAKSGAVPNPKPVAADSGAAVKQNAKENASFAARREKTGAFFRAAGFAPLVSIVIPVYNGADFMRDAIDTALHQTYPNTEVIVVNDGSRDGGATERIALSYGDRIRYIAKENGGVATALNAGIQAMRGEYFSWLSHDDMYKPDKLERELGELIHRPDRTLIVAGGYTVVNAAGTPLFDSNPCGEFPIERLEKPLFALLHGGINGCAMLVHKINFEKFGLFDPNLPTTQDYDLWFRMMRSRPIVYYNGTHVLSRAHDGQGSKANLSAHIRECDRLWIGIMNSLTPAEMETTAGSVWRFYYDVYDFLHRVTLYYGATDTALSRAWAEARKAYMDTGDEKPITAMYSLLGYKPSLLKDRYLPILREQASASEKAKPRIAFFLYSRHEGGGLNRIVLRLAEELCGEYDVILTCAGEPKPVLYETRPEVREVYFPETLTMFADYPHLLCLLGADLFIDSYNCLSGHLKLYERLKRLGVKTVAWNHEYYFMPYQRESLWECLPERFEGFDRADAVVWNNSPSAAIYGARHENAAYLPNFIDPPAKSAQTGARNPNEIVAVGRFEDPVKGLEPLLTAFSMILKAKPEAKLTVVGSANLDLPLPSDEGRTYRALIEKLRIPAKSIEFTGMVADVWKYYQRASINVLPSYCEGFGLVLLEAAVWGAPSVAFDGSGMVDLIRDGETGFLSPRGDAAAMAERVIRLLSDKALRNRCAEAARALAQTYRAGEIVPKWKTLINAVLSAQSGNPPELSRFAPEEQPAISRALAAEYEDAIERLAVKALKPPETTYANVPANEAAPVIVSVPTTDEELIRVYRWMIGSFSWRITKPLRFVRGFQLSLKNEGVKATNAKIRAQLNAMRANRKAKRQARSGKQK